MGNPSQLAAALPLITPRHPWWRRALAHVLSETGHIAMPGPLERYPLPPGITDQLVGVRPERIVIGTGFNPHLIKRDKGRVAWLLVTSTVAAVAYFVDTIADGDPDTSKRKMPAACPAGDFGGWMAAGRDMCAIAYNGIAVASTDTTAEIFIGLLD